MASSDTFDDFRKELNEEWKHHTSNFLSVFTTVIQNAFAQLLEKLPKYLIKSLKIMLKNCLQEKV